jgi:hypothetical protein
MIVFVALLALGLCFDEASAQRRRTRRSRRVTNPVATQTVTPTIVPSTQATEPQIISTADQQASEQGSTPEISGQVQPSQRRATNRRRAAVTEPEDEADSMRRTVTELSTQVTKLSDKLSQMEQQQRTLVDMERLSRAEVRAEALRTQLRDVQEKEGMLQARMEQIEYNLKPENIDRSVSTFGSTRPEEAREVRRNMLESDKVRTRAQLDLYATSRQRLETAIINADLEVDKLRKRIEDADDAELKTQTPQKRDATEPETDETEGTTTTTTTPPINAPASNTPPRR